MYASRESLISTHTHIFHSLAYFFLLKHCHCTIINEVVEFLLLIHKMSSMFQPVSNVLLSVLQALVFTHFNINFIVTTSIQLPGSIFWHMHDYQKQQQKPFLIQKRAWFFLRSHAFPMAEHHGNWIAPSSLWQCERE